MRKFSITILAVFWSLAAVSSAAYATDASDIAIALKTLPMLSSPLKGRVMAGIIYDRNDQESLKDANAIAEIIDGGLIAPGGATIVSTLVPSDDLAKLAVAKVAFIAKGTGSSFDAIASETRRLGILTISSDLTCVKHDKCILGVVSSPSVEIYYSPDAAESSHVNFIHSFSMLVRQG